MRKGGGGFKDKIASLFKTSTPKEIVYGRGKKQIVYGRGKKLSKPKIQNIKKTFIGREQRKN